MSIQFDKSDILFEQRLLASSGFYAGKLDGKYGPLTRAAEDKFQATYAQRAESLGSFDLRSEKNIFTLLPKMQGKAREILKAAYVWSGRRSFTFSILSGTRTYAEQDALFAKRPKVTNARGSQSNHNFGIAIDIGIFDMKGKYLTGANRAEEKAYADLGAYILANVPGVDWGGSWKSFPDAPHFEYATGLTIAQKRAKFEAGKLFL